jgi:hypothetical protein
MGHSEVNGGIICVFPPLDRFLSLGLIYSVNSTKSYPFIRCRIVVPNTKLNLVYLCYLEERYKTSYLRKRQPNQRDSPNRRNRPNQRSPDPKREKIALSERTRRPNEHYPHRTCSDRKKNSQSKMVNERGAPRRSSRRESIIPPHEVDEEGKAPTAYHIENLEQLRDWMKEDPEATSSMIQELRKNNDIMTSEYNMIIEKHDHLFDLYQALLNKTVNQDGGVPIGPVHDGGTPEPKLVTSKKLPDPPIFTDGKDPLIDDWLSAMRNKLEGNADWYLTALQEKAYVRTRIGGDAIRHLSSRFKKDSVKPFLSAEEIFEELNLIFGDPNKRVNSMKAFRRLKQLGPFKEFSAFWSEFQRLASDAELYDKEMLIEDLKDKMSFELQKAMVNESFDATELHAFARKCQYTDQVLRDVENKARYRGGMTGVSSSAGGRSNQQAGQPGGPSRQQTPAPAFGQHFRALTAPPQASNPGQVNTFTCYNCGKPGHMAKHCRSLPTPRIQEITEETETGTESGKD